MAQKTANEMFEDLKEHVLNLTDNMEKENVYQQFHAYLALLSMGQAVHGHGTDYDTLKISAQLRNEGEAYKDFYKDKKGICINLYIEQGRGLGLKAIDASCCDTNYSYYQDEYSNIENRNLVREYCPQYVCSCYVCAVVRTPKENWTSIHYKIASGVVQLLANNIEHNGPNKLEIEVERTKEELDALKQKLKEKIAVKKSKEVILENIKQLLEKGMAKEEIVSLIKSHYNKSEIAMDVLFKSDVQPLGQIKSNLDNPMELFCKSNSNVIANAFDSLEKSKYIRREGGPGNYKYIYAESNKNSKQGPPAKNDSQDKAPQNKKQPVWQERLEFFEKQFPDAKWKYFDYNDEESEEYEKKMANKGYNVQMVEGDSDDVAVVATKKHISLPQAEEWYKHQLTERRGGDED